MADVKQDKAVEYSRAYVKALAGAAEELSGILNEPDMLAGEPKGFSKLRNAVTGMMALGEDSSPQELLGSLERLQNAAEQTISGMQENGYEKGVHGIFAKGLAEFAKSQQASFSKHIQDALDPEQPINEQELEKKAAGRVKVSLDNLQKEVQGVIKEKHERVHTAEKNGPSKSSASMGKR